VELSEALVVNGAGEGTPSFDVFARHLDPAWIARALAATGTATVRRRKLPAEAVVWIVIGMGLLRDRSIQDVVRHLDLVLPDETRPTGRGVVTSSAVVQARDRLGAEPLAALFTQTAQAWAHASADRHRWRGLVLYGVDGSTLRVPDCAENEAAFGRPASSRGHAAYPQLRFVVLMALRSRLLAGAQLGRCTGGELPLAEPLWDQIPDASLTVMDRGLIDYDVFHGLTSRGHGRHWLVRAKSNLRWSVVQPLGPDEWLVDLPIQRKTRKAHPEMPQTLRARAIRYQNRGFRPQILLTSLLDAATFPAAELVTLYHERWEMELGFDEVKTHTLEREEALLRSREPERLRQEFWGLALGYNLVRLEMEQTAGRVGVPPRRISYRGALLLVRGFWATAWITSPGTLPRRLETFREEMAMMVLPERRPRWFPRAVKIKMSNYPLKHTTRALRHA